MEKIKILHCADIHIGAAESFLNTLAESRRAETLVTFERIIDKASENNVRVIAIAGDLFDSNNIESGFIEPVFKKIASVPDIKVIYAAGNHDPLNSGSPFLKYELPKNLYVLGIKDSVIAFDDIRLRVYGRSFESVCLYGEERFTITPQDDGYINLMVLHGEVKSDLNSEYNAVTQDFIKNSKMDYIALGHIHKRTEILKAGDTYYSYCGCPEGQGFDECGEKGVYIGNIGKGICELEFTPVAKRLHIRESVDISNCETPAAAADTVLSAIKLKYGEGFADNLYRIELTGNSPAEKAVNLSEITARLSDRLYFVKLKDRTEPFTDINTLANEISLKGIFAKKMLESLNCADEEQKNTVKEALKLGLKAFISEVEFNEDR